MEDMIADIQRNYPGARVRITAEARRFRVSVTRTTVLATAVGLNLEATVGTVWARLALRDFAQKRHRRVSQ